MFFKSKKRIAEEIAMEIEIGFLPFLQEMGRVAPNGKFHPPEDEGFVGPAFKRSEQRLSAGSFIDGLLSRAERKTGWMLAEEAGFARPYRIQSLLGRSKWSADDLCGRVRQYALSIVCREGFLIYCSALKYFYIATTYRKKFP